MKILGCYIIALKVADEYIPEYTSEVIYKRRTFTFTDSKLNELKKNVIAMGNTPMNPSRLEVLASLLFKCVVGGASTNKSYDSSLLYQPFNVRGIIAGNYPETTAGNVITCVLTKMKNSGQMQLNDMVNELRKRKMEVRGLRDMKEAAQYWTNTLSTLDQGRVYIITSVCKYPLYNVNFGWGKPLKATFDIPEVDHAVFVLMDTPSGDGIEATAHLREDEMAIFENDKEILAYVQEDV
ncbi:acylsugar acyltransferase 3-like protein [Tanacetum coccineum]